MLIKISNKSRNETEASPNAEECYVRNQMLGKCPVCSRELEVARLQCPHCGTGITVGSRSADSASSLGNRKSSWGSS